MSIKPTKRDLSSQRTRELIIDAAEKLFYQYGFETTSVKEVATEAGVTTGALYYHFKNKGDLVRAIFGRHDLNFEKLSASFAQSDKPLDDIVFFLADFMVDRIEEDGIDFTRQRIFNFFRFDTTTGFDDTLRTIIRRGIELGCFNAEYSEDDLYDCLSAVHRGAVYQFSVSADPVDLRDLISRRLHMTLKGLSSTK